MPQIQFYLNEPKNSRVQVVDLSGIDELGNDRAAGRKLYYLPYARDYNIAFKGIDPVEQGASLICSGPDDFK